MKKLDWMRALESHGLSFTANVIMNGCGKPTTKMRTLVKLIEAGHDVRQAQFETCAVVVDGEYLLLGQLDQGPEAVLKTVAILKEEHA